MYFNGLNSYTNKFKIMLGIRTCDRYTESLNPKSGSLLSASTDF